MQVLEKILEEIKEVEKKFVVGHEALFALGATGLGSEIEEIIRSHMNDDSDNWIPCSERLPEEGDIIYPMQIVTLDNGDVCLGVYRHDDKEWLTRMSEGELYYTNSHIVVAWMPLPEPYKPKKTTVTGMLGTCAGKRRSEKEWNIKSY